MENERYTLPPPTSSIGSGPSTNQSRASYATERAKVLFAGYRRGDANDPDGYVASIAAVLSLYEPELIRRVTDPRTGISTTEKFLTFMPNSGELKNYCDQQAERDARLRRYRHLPSREAVRLIDPPPKGPGHRANVIVLASAPQYAAMVERAQKHTDPLDFKYENNGISVPITWLLDRPLSDPFSNAMVARMAEPSPPAAG